nr:XRE family transcriptional regulator [Actinomycetota bacterium]
LRHLEELLDVPPGSLSALLGPARPRGRQRIPGHAEISELWQGRSDLDDALRGVDTRWDERLYRVSQHDQVFIGPDGEDRSVVSRQVLRAEQDGPDRWVMILHLDEHGVALPVVRPTRHCTLGRVVSRPEVGLLVAELLFDHPLTKGETIITEHELISQAPGPPATNYERKFRLPVREYVLEVCFDPTAIPTSCARHTKIDGVPERARPVPVDATGTVHGVVLDFGPGSYGFHWEWD